MNSRWYAFRDSQDDETESVEVSIYDEIGFGGVTAKDFMAELREHKGKHVELRINSVGGSVIEGAAIYNALRRHKGGLTVYVDGLAASMASVIAMAGDKVSIASNALFMIHNPWSMSMGDAEDMRKEADVLDKLKNTLVNAYTRKTGMTAAAISRLMDEETWLDAAESVDLGFADEIEDGIEAAASITPEQARARFANFMKAKSNPTLPAVDITEEAMNAELQAKVTALQGELDARNAEVLAKTQSFDEATVEVDSLKGEIDRISAELATKAEEATALAAEVAAKDEQIAALQASAVSAGQQAAAIVAAAGIDPGTAGVTEPVKTAAQIFASLSGPEATEYFRKNKAAIVATFKS